MQSKHKTEIAARAAAAKHGSKDITIIASQGVFYVETEPTIIRLFERVVFDGKGRNAVKEVR